ncbi:ABC transporter permease [Nocardioides acrostichi]|uniref:ABC transporter permease n=1 Tax=Nocardioides acrostichi TaxID=2784339 RepID=A0A930V157_9ACTN|nr:ABC transporter permease [Nocardioides acrostichi]MBF4161971.1 ABC transporter permease [Nocardioides acrostichi]
MSAAPPVAQVTPAGTSVPAGGRLPAQKKSRSLPRAIRFGLGLIVPTLIVGGWQLVVSAKLLPSALLPAPGKVIETFGLWLGIKDTPQMFYSGHLLGDVGATSQRVIVGFALATVMGVVVGTAIGVWTLADYLLTPTLRVLGPIPPPTWIPVVIVIVGIGQSANYTLTFLGALFPVVASTVTAVSGVNRELLRAGRMMGHGQLGLIAQVVIPGALPGIVGGLRIGLGLAWMMAVTSEMLAVHSGLGYTLWNAYNYFDYPAVFAAMILTGLCGLLSDVVLQLLTRKATEWHAETGVRR